MPKAVDSTTLNSTPAAQTASRSYSRQDRLVAWIEVLRPHQWIKNLLVFAAPVFGRQLFIPEQFLAACIAFAAMCLVASAVYTFNDIRDIDADRLHPLKRNRPVASGRISTPAARALMLVLAVSGVTIGFLVSRPAGYTLCAYILLNVLYSLRVKHIVILDVMFIALGFALRVLLGAFAVHVQPSYWLFLCTINVSLFLGFGKRRAEVVSLAEAAAGHRRVLEHYSPAFLDQMIAIVTSATLVCYILYTVDRRTVEVFDTHLLVLTVPFVLYGLFRYLYLLYHRKQGDSPTTTILLDWAFLLNAALWAATCIAVIYAHETLEKWISFA